MEFCFGRGSFFGVIFSALEGGADARSGTTGVMRWQLHVAGWSSLL